MEQIPALTLPEGYLDFYRALESWQNVYQMKLKEQLPPPPGSSPEVLEELRLQRQPWFKLHPPIISSELYRDCWLGLLDFLAQNRQEVKDSLPALYQCADHLDFSQLPELCLREETGSIAIPEETSADLLLFSLEHAIRPFLRYLAMPYYELIQSDQTSFWDQPKICPVCGGISRLSRFRSGDSKRFMFCDRCFTEWNANYLLCVHCGSTEVYKVKFLTLDQTAEFKLMVCDNCHGYAKCYDEYNCSGGARDMFVANMETVYLDLLAQKEGYYNPE